MTAYRVKDELTGQSYAVKTLREVSDAIDWILSGQDLEEYDEQEIDALLALAADGESARSDVLGISVTVYE